MAGGPGGPIVGRVRLRVAPDLSGFRKKVEKDLAGYDDFEMGITPDLGDFKKRVGRATRGMNASVAVGADTKGFREQMSQAMDRARAGKVNIQTGLAVSRRGLRRQIANIGKMVRSAAGHTAVVGGQIDWAMGGQASRRKITAWLDQVRNKAGDAGIALKALDTTPTVASANNSIHEIERVIKGLKEIQGVRKALNRNAKNKSYNPQLHEEYLQLERMAKSLRGTNVSDSITDIDELTKRIREFGAKASDSAAVADRLGKHLIRARRGIDALAAASKTAKLPSISVFNPNAVIPETADRRLVRRTKELGGKIVQAMAPVVRRINNTVRTIGRVTHKVARGMARPFVWAGRGVVAAVKGTARGVGSAIGSIAAEVKGTAQLSREMWDRMRQRLSRLRDGARATSTAFSDMQAAERGFRPGSGRGVDFVSGLEGAGPRLERELTQAFDNSGRSVERFKERTTSLGDVFRKLPGIAGRSGESSFKKFWRKFHQSDQKKFGMAPGAWMVTAVTALVAPLSGLIGGALASLPALGLAAAAALGATVLGWEGIKTAAEAAAPAVDQAKEVLSGTFQDRLTPQFASLGEVLGKITPDLDNVANGLADFSQGFVNSLSSGAGLGNMKELLGNTAGLFSDLAPFAESFTDGLLIMGAAGSRAFEHLSESLNGFGDNFKQSMQEMADDGTLQSSIEATFDVLGSLGSNLGKVMRAGMEEMPAMTESFTGALDSLGNGLVALMPLLADFSIGLLDGLSVAFDGITARVPELTSIFDDIGPGLKDSLSGLGDIVGTAFDSILDFTQGLAPGAGDALSAIGEGLSDMARSFRNAEGLQGLIRDTGSAIGEFLSVTAKGNGFGHDLKLNAAEVAEGLEGYGDAVTRALQGTSGQAGLIRSAAVDIEQAVRFRFTSVSEAITSGQAALEQAQDSLKIDLSFEIDRVGAADTTSEVQEILRGVADGVRDNAYSSIKVEPEISIDPKVDLGSAVENLQAQSSQAKADLGAAIDQFVIDAEAIGEAVEIDISPQLRAVEDATSASAFRDAALAVVARLEGATEPEQVDVAIDPQAKLADEGAALGNQIQEQVSGAVEGLDLTESVQPALDSALGEMDFSTTVEGIGTSLGDALGGVEVPTEGLSTSLMAAFDGLSADITARVQEIGTTAGTDLSTMFSGVSVDTGSLSSTISTEISSAISTAMTEAASTATTSAQAIVTAATEGLSGMPGEFGTKGTEAGTSLSEGIGGTAEPVATAAGSLKTAAVNAVSGIDVTASGEAVGITFAAGIRSRIWDVQNAAGELAAAARDNFPNSPAKIGPFSGSGWVDKSGIAVGMDFAKGMRSQAGAVGDAAAAVVEAAKWQFDKFTADLPGSMEGHHRNEILQPVLESNAKKIASYRERDADSAEKLNERIAKINESDADEAKKAEQIAKAREDAAERTGESYEKLLESLETPEYGDINRSIQSYWIDGSKDVLRKGLLEAVESADLAGRIRDISMAGVREGRRVFGTHPIFDQAEAAVNAEHFSRILQKVIEDSGIAEIPIDFAMANLDQLKSDLGMGDGVISRAIDAAISTDPANTDARWARKNPVEIHYHVADMEEAIRPENERERKGMIKYKN